MSDGVSVGSWLAGVSAGPQLGAVLASLDMAAVPNDSVVDVLQACARQRAHAEGLYLTAVAAVLERDPVGGPASTARVEVSDRYASDEVRAGLALTRRRAEFECAFAEALCRELPAVHAQMLAGRIDRDRALVFTHHLAGLPAELVARVVALVLPFAGGLTTGQLRARILKLIIAVDPDLAEDRYEQALAQRMVVGYLDSTGTATITATGLPPDEAAAATERIAVLARAAKRAGHRSTVDQLRADIFLRLLDGRFHHLTRTDMVAALLDEALEARASSVAQARDAEASDVERRDPEPIPTAGAAPGQNAAAMLGRVPGIEVRARLDTLTGANELPGELPGWGPVLASVARRAAARQHGGQWRWAVTNAHGYLLAEGVTRSRPGTGPPAHRAEGGIVELAIPATVLDRLAKDPPPAWSSVIADIAVQYQHAGGDDQAARLNAQPRRRHPGAALRRHTQIRDRTCTAPGCRRSAAQSEQDHTHDHQHGGPTTSANLAPACAHDHQLKHRGGWTVTQPRPGHFHWTSPLGRTYPTRGEPITDPDPPPF